jgi:hypothetical protein
MVPKERWLPTSSISGPMGQAFARTDQDPRGISMTAWQGPSGHHAEIEHESEESYGGAYGGITNSRYVAGPYRTPRRARIAAEAGANRIEAGKDMSKYESGSYTDTVRNPRYPRT